MTTSPVALAERLAADVARIDGELAELDLLIGQARTEAGRHDGRRAAALERLTGPGAAPDAGAVAQLATLTQRAALMSAQVEVLEAKRKALARLREVTAEHAAAVRELGSGEADAAPGGTGVAASVHARLVNAAQEDLRREIARAMHDGPAQSLTNIVLQARIAERLMATDAAAAAAEVGQLVAMTQQTLEATKTFIFEVRPMVLDDLGLVPTLRRAARERGQRAGVAVEFETLGLDRRLPVDVESALFRTLDEAIVGFLAAGAERVSLRLDWADDLVATIAAGRAPAAVPDPDLPESTDMPPALAAMVENRREAHAGAIEAARRAAVVILPAAAVREARDRAAILGYAAEVGPDGDRLVLRVPLGAPGPA